MKIYRTTKPEHLIAITGDDLDTDTGSIYFPVSITGVSPEVWEAVYRGYNNTLARILPEVGDLCSNWWADRIIDILEWGCVPGSPVSWGYLSGARVLRTIRSMHVVMGVGAYHYDPAGYEQAHYTPIFTHDARALTCELHQRGIKGLAWEVVEITTAADLLPSR